MVPEFVVAKTCADFECSLAELFHYSEIGVAVRVFAPPVEPAGYLAQFDEHADKFLVRNACEEIEQLGSDLAFRELYREGSPVESVSKRHLVFVTKYDGNAASYDGFVEMIRPG